MLVKGWSSCCIVKDGNSLAARAQIASVIRPLAHRSGLDKILTDTFESPVDIDEIWYVDRSYADL